MSLLNRDVHGRRRKGVVVCLVQIGNQEVGPFAHSTGKVGRGEVEWIDLEPGGEEQDCASLTHEGPSHGIAGAKPDAGRAGRASEVGQGGEVGGESDLQKGKAEGEQGLARPGEELFERSRRQLGMSPANITPPAMSLVAEIALVDNLTNTSAAGRTGGW